MKETTEKMIEKIEEEHDWRKGQTWGGRGTYLSSTDVCRVCGMSRRWETDPQNGVHDEYTFTDAEGNEIPLREAAARKCLLE